MWSTELEDACIKVEIITRKRDNKAHKCTTRNIHI